MTSNQPIDRDRFLIAYGMYVAFRRGLGTYGSRSGPYPVYAWAQLPDAYRAGLLRKADRFLATPELPLSQRLFEAWHVDRRPIAWKRSKPWVSELWSVVAAEYRRLGVALDQDREAA